MATTNYLKAMALVDEGFATENPDTECIEFSVDYGKNAFGFIFPEDINATVCFEGILSKNIHDCGRIDLNRMQVIGCQDNYDIVKEVR